MFLKVFTFVGLLIGLSWTTSCPLNYQYEPGLSNSQGACIGLASSEKETFDVNERTCQSNGGHLIKISSSFDNGIVQTYFRRLLPQSSVAQIGLRRNGSTWLWTDGTPLAYTYWGSSSGGDCVYMYIQEGSSPVWYAYPCEQKFFGLCQNPVSNCPSGWTYFQQTGKCYYHGRNATLDQAKQYCASKGGQLASIHSAAENLFVRDLITTDRCYGYYYGSSFYDSHVILGGNLYAQNNGLWWDNSNFDYIPSSLCIPNQPSATPIIYIDGAPQPCASCGGYLGGWRSSSTSLATNFIFPGYLCKAPPLPTVQLQPSGLKESNQSPAKTKI